MEMPMDQREAIYAERQRNNPINTIAQEVAQQISPTMQMLTPEEYHLVLLHRQKKEQRRKQILSCIDDAVNACGSLATRSTVARDVFEALISKGYINDAN